MTQPKSVPKGNVVNVTLPPEDHKRLRIQAANREIPMTRLARDIITKLLDEQDRKATTN